MSNIKLKNASGTETTYTGITSVKIPLADGTGNATFSEGGGGIEGGYDVMFKCKSSYSESSYSDYSFISVKQGNSISEPPTPSISGGACQGWAASEGGSTAISFPYTPASDATLWAILQAASSVLDENTWAVISSISAAGTGASYWSVGDVKYITLNGTAGSLTLSSVELGVYILGFNHNSSIEGSGISFGTFKSRLNNSSSSKERALVDSGYNSSKTSGTWFNMNNASSNTGGWKNSRMRYYALGSTDTLNNDASSTTATSPVSGSLMSCLPSDLRAVMKPITKYSDNTGGGSDTASYVTATVDYLPLLAEYEVHGTRSYANSAEQSHQARYTFFTNGNSKVKYKHDSEDTACFWWLRSVDSSDSSSFCFVYTGGRASANYAGVSYGVSPAFLV